VSRTQATSDGLVRCVQPFRRVPLALSVHLGWCALGAPQGSLR